MSDTDKNPYWKTYYQKNKKRIQENWRRYYRKRGKKVANIARAKRKQKDPVGFAKRTARNSLRYYYKNRDKIILQGCCVNESASPVVTDNLPF